MQATDVEGSFSSTLEDGAERFLAYAIEHAMKCGRRTPQDFMRHFPPATIMEGLEDEPELRANILVAATGVRLKVALKKNAASCGADLQIALEEGETSAAIVVGQFDPDDRVRFLDNRSLWRFLTEGDFWQVDAKKDPKTHAVAAAHISYLIDRALEEELLTHRDIVKGITVTNLVNLLPRPQVPKIIEAALDLGAAKKPFVDKNLLDAVGMSMLATHIPLASIWNQLIVPYIAEPHGLVDKSEEPVAVAPAKVVEAARPEPVRPEPVRPKPADVSPPTAQPKQTSSAVFKSVARPVGSMSPAVAAAPAPARHDESSMDVDVDEALSALTPMASPAPRSVRRRGSVPPNA